MALSTFHIQDTSLTSLGDSRLLVQCETGISDHSFVTCNGNHKVFRLSNKMAPVFLDRDIANKFHCIHCIRVEAETSD